MCQIIKKLELEAISGYKIVAHKDGSFYSTFTGQKYELNKPIEGIKRRSLRMSGHWTAFLDLIKTRNVESYGFFNPDFKNKTSVSLSYKAIKTLGHDINDNLFQENKKYDIVLVEMTLGGDIYKGYYKSIPNIYAGTLITKIEILHTYENPYQLQKNNL